VTQPPPVRAGGLRLGLRANLAQFSLLVGVNALVGGMVGQERSLLSLLATEVFGLAAVSAALTYIVAFASPRRPPTSWPAPWPTATAASPSWSLAGCSGCRCRC
jgi:hypothetical protein